MFGEDAEELLFNVKEDLYEINNVIQDHREVAETMRSMLPSKFVIESIPVLDLEEEFVVDGTWRTIIGQQKEIRFGSVCIMMVASIMMVLVVYVMRRDKNKTLETEAVKHKPVSYGALQDV